MKNLIPHSGDFSQLIEKIINDKNEPGKTRILALRPRVEKRYSEYKLCFDRDTIHTLKEDVYASQEKADLTSCYESQTVSLGLLLKEIVESQDRDLQGTCQYCGIHHPKSIDHYLPQSKFPEFSALALNLLPCCTECNSKKGNYWLKNGYRGIINFYRDILPEEQFLFCDIHYDHQNNIPVLSFKLKVPATINPALAIIIESHFERLELCDRYIGYTHDFVSSKKDSITSYLNSTDLNEIQKRLQIDAEKLKKRLGINNWKVVLSYELSKSTRFIQLLQSEILIS